MNKETRISVYKVALQNSCVGINTDYGLCYMLAKTIYDSFPEVTVDYNLDYGQLMIDCPEISKHNPNRKDTYWFPSGQWIERRQILEQAIQELEA